MDREAASAAAVWKAGRTVQGIVRLAAGGHAERAADTA
jgi:hypothetical protein